MKTIINYFRRSGVDSILLLVSIAVAVKVSKDNPFASAMLCFLILYILGAIFRMGQMADLLNDNIINPITRARLGLGVRPGSIVVSKKTTFEKIVQAVFWLGFVAMLIFFMLDK
jgi:hypothetical protein